MKQLVLGLDWIGDTLDRQLDKITSYRLVLYLLYLYVAVTLVLSSLTDRLPFSTVDLILSAALIVGVCRAANWLFASLFKLPKNKESDLITSLILILILTPASSRSGFLMLAGAALTAIASKYVLTINRRHLFNPAAFGAFAAGLTFHSYASWWVSSAFMAPFLIVGAILILKKMKRFQMVIAFLVIYLVYLGFSISSPHLHHALWIALISTPVIFFGSVMLTEPLTSPRSYKHSLIYAMVVGVFYSVTKLRVSPEEALLIGNFAAYAMYPNRSLLLNFVKQQKDSEGIYSFFFQSPKKIQFEPGQYLEWTLPVAKSDNRGNRRYMTIASSPTEPDMMVTVKIPATRPSSFKKSLMALKPGDQILASQLSGSFIMPKAAKPKLAFLAGGVGVTPFRSMLKYLIDSRQDRDVSLLYSVNSADEIAYADIFKAAQSSGFKNHYVISGVAPPGWSGSTGFIDDKLIKSAIPDYSERLFYVSGPQSFVAAVRQTLLRLGVKRSHIHTDFFPGYN